MSWTWRPIGPLLVQVVAVGVSHDPPSAIEEGKAGLRKRAGLVRENAGFPIIRGMFFGGSARAS